MMIYSKLTFTLILALWFIHHYWPLTVKKAVVEFSVVLIGVAATYNPIALTIYFLGLAIFYVIRIFRAKNKLPDIIITISWLILAGLVSLLSFSWLSWVLLLFTLSLNFYELRTQQHYLPLNIMTLIFDVLILTLFLVVSPTLQFIFVVLAGLMTLITTSLIHYLFQETDMVFARSLDKMMTNYTQEVQSLYEGMRGWRHDYHDHLQTLKAYLDQQQVKEARHYLDDLEDKLEEVDPVVHSGNPVLDAVVNSKLTLAEKLNIPTNVKVFVGTQPLIDDVDLVVIIGNLMDNAIEAISEQATGEKKLLRVYISILKQQLYISITNSRPDTQIIDPEYASTKNDKRGLGIRRINHLVANYSGMINRQYQPGVFVTEIMLPLAAIHAEK